MKVSDDLQGVLQAAYEEAKERKHEYLTPEHILYAAMFFDVAREIIASCQADPDEIKEGLDEHLSKRVPVVKEAEPFQSLSFQADQISQLSRHCFSRPDRI